MTNIDLIIFSGQSNMQGQSEALTNTTPIPHAWEYKYLTDTLVPLKNPVGENITLQKTEGVCFTKDSVQQEWLDLHLTGSSVYGNTNLVPEFCKAYTRLTKQEVAAVHIAKGSTVIAEWLPESDGYDILTEKAKMAIRKVKEAYEINHIFFVWLQGESDAIYKSSKAYYKEKLTELNHALKRDLGIEQFGIIRVGRFTNDERDEEIIQAQSEICLENQEFLMLTDRATELNRQAEFMNPDVKGHFSAKGLELLGKLAGKALGVFVNEQ